MGITPSTMTALGTAAPAFELPDTMSGGVVRLRDFGGKKGLLVIFLCNHCPYVKHLQEGFAQLSRDYEGKDLAIAAISANDAAGYPDDAPEKLGSEAKRLGYRFPVLYDESQKVAAAYQAACTPDFFLFDRERKLAYRGQFDDSRPGNGIPVTGKDLRAAIDAVLADRPVSPEQRPSTGCNIKWRAASKPEYVQG